jgi:hypothetical protein
MSTFHRRGQRGSAKANGDTVKYIDSGDWFPNQSNLNSLSGGGSGALYLVFHAGAGALSGVDNLSLPVAPGSTSCPSRRSRGGIER